MKKLSSSHSSTCFLRVNWPASSSSRNVTTCHRSDEDHHQLSAAALYSLTFKTEASPPESGLPALCYTLVLNDDTQFQPHEPRRLFPASATSKQFTHAALINHSRDRISLLRRWVRTTKTIPFPRQPYSAPSSAPPSSRSAMHGTWWTIIVYRSRKIGIDSWTWQFCIGVWLGMSLFSGIADCLEMFTALEVLGESIGGVGRSRMGWTDRKSVV